MVLDNSCKENQLPIHKKSVIETISYFKKLFVNVTFFFSTDENCEGIKVVFAISLDWWVQKEISRWKIDNVYAHNTAWCRKVDTIMSLPFR